MTTDQDIVDALNAAAFAPVGTGGLSRLRASADQPAALAAGAAWPRHAGWQPADAGWAIEQLWKIFIVLPQDDKTASAWCRANIEALFDTLRPVLYVDLIEPVMLPAGKSMTQLYALQITGSGE